MREIGILTATEIRSLFGWNRFLHTKDPKEKNRYRLLMAVIGLLAVMAIFYIIGLVIGLSYLELGSLIPSYLAFLASLIVFFIGIFQAGKQLFRTHGYDLLTAMPIHPSSVVISRWIVLYLQNAAFVLVALLPGLVTYGALEHPVWYFYPMSLLLGLLLPAIPLSLSALLGTLILWISSRMKHKAAVESVLMILLVIAIFASVYFLAGDTEAPSLERLSELATLIGDLIGSIYPPAVWYADAALMLDPISVLSCSFLPLLVLATVLSATIWSYSPITEGLRPISARRAASVDTLTQKGLWATLCRREAKRYFSSAIYVTNTILGPILGTVAAVALVGVGLEKIETAMPPELSLNLRAALPMAVAGIFCMMPPTSVSVSMEGKSFWILQTLPIPTGTLFDAKVLFWLLLAAPFYLASVILMAIALSPALIELLWIITLPAACLLFCTVLGIAVDLKFGRTGWEREEVIVKQSASAGIGGFGGFLICLAFCIPLLFLEGIWSHLARGVMLALLLLGAYFIRKHNNRKQLCHFE